MIFIIQYFNPRVSFLIYPLKIIDLILLTCVSVDVIRHKNKNIY